METQWAKATFTYASIMVFVATQLLSFAACDSSGPQMGVNYGTNGNNLPAPADVVNLLNKIGVSMVRLYEPNADVFNALRGSSNLDIIVGIKNQDIPNIASSPDAAAGWVNTNIIPWKGNINIVNIVVGNEVIPGPYANVVAQAMANIKAACNSVGMSYMLVTTTTAFNLQTSFPPSAGAFPADVAEIMKDVTRVLRDNQSPLMVSFYPYFAYASNPQEIPLDYALFNAKTPVIDGQLQYFSLLEAQMDAYYAALAAIGAGDVPIVIAETGWPTAGNEPFTSVANAQTYNTNLINRVKSRKGTPRAAPVFLDAIIFAMFDENLKPEGLEQHWGIFSPTMEPKYPLAF